MIISGRPVLDILQNFVYNVIMKMEKAELSSIMIQE